MSVLQARLGWSPRKTTRARVNTQMASFGTEAHAEAIIRLSDRLRFCRHRPLAAASLSARSEEAARRTLCELQPSEQRGTTVVSVCFRPPSLCDLGAGPTVPPPVGKTHCFAAGVIVIRIDHPLHLPVSAHRGRNARRSVVCNAQSPSKIEGLW